MNFENTLHHLLSTTFHLFLFLLCCIQSIFSDTSSCRKQVECFICDSRNIPECENSNNFLQVHIPTKLCDDYCLKMWTRENESISGTGIQASRYVKRDCHKIFRYHIKKAETCYKHKKHTSDVLCLCGTDRCNSAKNLLKFNWLFFFTFCTYFYTIFYSRTYR
ncbi:unnamed protein product [Didymodactylos carnosus]|uniref:Protein quiver n=1 Tax=Didymodactylos carnosus TaxID=1234261 RepID=A0A813R9T0_9BILA|nr:unnamed protein product [Didymodactylos carnosus]CAF0918756.1 unnamed protein product [Didymodactylos carnosus]CAF3564172.1 unnamed protein product [Didymodactylos carnosus]CAF3696582.1 unnamed protein product [Didymodactylos carnosus]